MKSWSRVTTHWPGRKWLQGVQTRFWQPTISESVVTTGMPGYFCITSMTTSVPRYNVLHEPEGEVYVLHVANLTPEDSGMYICQVDIKVIIMINLTLWYDQVNSVPSSLSYHQLKVISEEDEDSRDSLIDSKDEQFASCCIRANISDACRGFCSLNILLMGVDGTSPDDCEDEFPAIAASMADGRDHQPCCLKMGVPEVCTYLCKGEYNKKTDNIKTIFNCREHMPRTLACIAAGVGEDFLLTISRKVSLIFFTSQRHFHQNHLGSLSLPLTQPLCRFPGFHHHLRTSWHRSTWST